MSQSIWSTYEIKEGEAPLHLTLDALHAWIKKQNEEFWVSHQYANEDNPTPELGEKTEWSRWAPKADEQEIKVSPVFQDYPVIVSSEYPLKLVPGAKIRIYCRIPVWIQISLAKSKYVLQEIPVTKLSRTWFGTPLEGELCYWLTSKARRSLDEVEHKPFVINCPIQITNKSGEDLVFERFCYRVERLGIYYVNNDLWADETQIVYQGDALNSDVNMTGKLPANIGKGELLTKPRNPVSKSLATRTFKMLFEDTIV